jgi:hypothetical protein
MRHAQYLYVDASRLASHKRKSNEPEMPIISLQRALGQYASVSFGHPSAAVLISDIVPEIKSTFGEIFHQLT